MGGKPVAQEDPMGCGIACVAFICAVSYKSAKHLFDMHNDTKPGCYCPDIVNALQNAGRAYRWRRIGGRRIRYIDRSIIFIKRSRSFPAGHFLARWKGVWMDPWINLDASNPGVGNARAGFRKRLPGMASYCF
ncbi:MAG: hypothetical protein V1861_01395 [Candidatus Micrarchaeota archaeon]